MFSFKKATFKPSIQQSAVFDAAKALAPGEATIVEAAAGSGKTTTIEHAVKRLGVTRRDALVVAFSKDVERELKSRRIEAQVKTLHALGYAALRDGPIPQAEAVGGKLYRMSRERIKNPHYRWPACSLVDAARSAAVGCTGGLDDTEENWQRLAEFYAIPTPKAGTMAGVTKQARRLLADMVADALTTDTIDFGDMEYLPLLLAEGPPLKRTPQYIFVDEAQDINAAQLLLLQRFADTPEPPRFVFVGDSAQAIYGWRGAGVDALQTIEEAFDAKRLPLSVSYRCPKAVVREAAQYGEIEAAPNAPEGVCGPFPGNWRADLKPTDAVLCRNNAPLIVEAVRLLGNGHRVNFRSKDVLSDIKFQARAAGKVAKRHGATAWRAALAVVREREVERNSDRPMVLARLEDVFDALDVLGEQAERKGTSVEALIDALSDAKQGVTLSTIHRAKGLEWARVFFLSPGLIPNRFAKEPWMLQQEGNLYYVAVTRARQALYFVEA